MSSPIEDIRILAELIVDVAKVKSHRRRRIKWLIKYRRDLFERVKVVFEWDDPPFDIFSIEDEEEVCPSQWIEFSEDEDCLPF